MASVTNVYCDESCHLEHDKILVMVLGCVWMPAEATGEVSSAIRQIKVRHGMPSSWEGKWVKISPAKTALYLELIDFFFDTPSLHFRGVLIPDKGVLNHSAFKQTHDSWYYKMLFTMLEPIIDPEKEHCIYLDMKDTRSDQKCVLLERVLRSAKYDSSGDILRRVQQIRSHESESLQLADLLIGAVAYHNRVLTGDLHGKRVNGGKIAVVKRIQGRAGKSLERTTWLKESKFNLLRWEPKQESRDRVQ